MEQENTGFVVIANAKNLSDDSSIFPFVETSSWYDKVPNLNDPYILYARTETMEEAEAIVEVMPKTKVRAELWKQNRTLAQWAEWKKENNHDRREKQ